MLNEMKEVKYKHTQTQELLQELGARWKERSVLLWQGTQGWGEEGHGVQEAP